MVENVILLIVCFVLAFVFLSFALLDHRYPDAKPGLLACSLGAALITFSFSYLLIAATDQTKINGAMVMLGLLTGPIIAPPLYVDKARFPTLTSRIVEQIRCKLSAFMLIKVFSALIYGLILFVFLVFDLWKGFWIILTGALCVLLMLAKTAALAKTALVQRQLPKECLLDVIRKRELKRATLAILGFMLLWSSGPFATVMILDYAPNAWPAVFGFSISALFTSGTNSKI